MENNRNTNKNTQSRAAQQTQNNQPRKKSRGPKTIKKVVNTFSYILLILGIALLISGFAIVVANDVFALVKEEQTVMLTLDAEKTPAEMGQLLEENQIIKYPWVFSLFSKMKQIESFDTGKFEVSATMDYGQIISALTRVATYRETVTVTIPEGYTIQQIAQLMEDTRVCGKNDFVETANTYDYSHDFLKDVPMVENRLEGYLFPDTYEFYISDKPVNVINKMLNNFDKKYSKEMLQLTEEAGFTVADIVNIASMIEKEAQKANERTVISGVIHNRLNNSDAFPYLNIDATVMYAIGHKEKLTSADMETDTPYNTYKYSGLPPTAICNPGIASIVAAISPEEHGYYYYVAEKDGSHIFSRTYDEHQAAIRSVQTGE